jgi:uncharacterized protein (UPF0335 family)
MNVDANKLKAYLDSMDDEADARDKHSAQIRDIVKRAKGDGFDTKALRKVHVRRRMDASVRQRDDDLLDIYEHALGAKGAALRAIEAGASVGEAATANGVHRATLARARNVAKQVSNATPPHDPETGEIRDALILDAASEMEAEVQRELRDALNLAPDSAPERDMSSASPSDCTGGVSAKNAHTESCGASEDDRQANVADAPLRCEGSRPAEPSAPPQDSITDDDPGPIPHFLRRPKQEEASV